MKNLPGEIERASMAVIEDELLMRGLELQKENAAVIKRCIHASADFDYARNLRFTPAAAALGAEALRHGTAVITDTNMALAGLSRPSLEKLGCAAFCFMADPLVAENARSGGTTRAVAAVDLAAAKYPGAVHAVGNAPTALLRLAEIIGEGLRPALVIGVPVGFVNVVESKEVLLRVCEEKKIPAIVALGRKGGSSIAAAICNALLYTACGTLDPAARGWR